MHLAIYLSLNALYFFFGVLLVNTIRKEFFSQTEQKIMSKLVANDIFIPDKKTKGNYYLNEILKMKKKPHFIFIFPESNRLVYLDEFWSILYRKYHRHLDFVHNFVVPMYDISNFNEVKRLEADIYTMTQFPQIFILKKRNNKNKIYILTDKKKSYDLLKICRDEDFYMIQKLDDSIFRSQKKIFLLESYLLLVRRPQTITETYDNKSSFTIEMYRYSNIRYMLLDMESNQLAYCQHIEKLFKTRFYQFPAQKMIQHIDLNYKFIQKNFSPEFEGLYVDLDSTCFEILSLKYLINQEFRPFLYQIDRNVELYGGLDKEMFADLVNQVHLCVREKNTFDREKLVQIE